jgi:hypothetical protein
MPVSQLLGEKLHWTLIRSLCKTNRVLQQAHIIINYKRECQAVALPHEKCYRKKLMPQIENVTQIKLRMHPNGVKHERKTGGNEGI